MGGISINFCFEFIFSAAWNNFGHKGDNSSWCWFSKLFPPRVWTFFDLYLNIFVEVCFVFLTSKCEMRKALFLKNKKNLLKNNIGLRAKVFLFFIFWKIIKCFWKTMLGWERRYFYAKAKEKNFLPAAILSFLMKWAAIKTNISPQSLWETRFLGKTTKNEKPAQSLWEFRGKQQKMSTKN